MYRIKEGKKDELLEGKTITHVAKLCGCSRQYLNLILNGSEKKKATFNFVIKLLTRLASESKKISYQINNLGLKVTIENYFEKID